MLKKDTSLEASFFVFNEIVSHMIFICNHSCVRTYLNYKKVNCVVVTRAKLDS